MTILKRGRSEKTEVEERVGEACMSDSEPSEKNFFIAKTGVFSIDQSFLEDRECQNLCQELWMRER